MEKGEILLNCDIHFLIKGEIGDRKVSFIKRLLIQDLVSSIRSSNWGSKKYSPSSSVPIKGHEVDVEKYLDGLTITLLTEDEAISLLK